jgi:hypothetical protein
MAEQGAGCYQRALYGRYQEVFICWPLDVVDHSPLLNYVIARKTHPIR